MAHAEIQGTILLQHHPGHLHISHAAENLDARSHQNLLRRNLHLDVLQLLHPTADEFLEVEFRDNPLEFQAFRRLNLQHILFQELEHINLHTLRRGNQLRHIDFPQLCRMGDDLKVIHPPARHQKIRRGRQGHHHIMGGQTIRKARLQRGRHQSRQDKFAKHD